MSEFSKFDTQIHCEEMFINEPTEADLQEYADWLDSQEASEPQLDADDWNAFDGHLDLYDEIEGESGWEELESDDGHRELYEEEDYEPQDDYYDYADLMEY